MNISNFIFESQEEICNLKAELENYQALYRDARREALEGVVKYLTELPCDECPLCYLSCHRTGRKCDNAISLIHQFREKTQEEQSNLLFPIVEK